MPGKKFKVLTRHRRFVKHYVSGESAAAAGRHKGIEFSEDYVYELLEKPEIIQLIHEAEKAAGLTDELLARAHVELVQQDTDRSVRLGAVRLGYQLKKKIGSDDGPPPGLPPAVVIIRAESGDTKSAKPRISVDAEAGPRIRRANQST